MQSRVAPLTGLRAVAAATVCLTHAAFSTGHYTDDFVGHLWARFEIGVPIFFALSGFLLFRPWVRLLQDGSAQQPDLRRYAWHRFRRVVPAYWVVVIVVYALGLVRHEPNPSGGGIDGLVRNLTFTQIYGFGHLRVGLTQAWSLAVEMAFYLALPLIGWILTALLCRYRWHPGRLLAGLAALAAITPVWIVIAPSIELTARMWPPAYLWWFLAGMALTVAAAQARRWPRGATAACLAVALLAFVVSALPVIGGPPTMVPRSPVEAIVKSALYLVIAAALIAPLGLAPHSGSLYHRLLGSRPIVWLGGISYEYFLVHLIVMDVLLLDVLGWRPFTGNIAVAFLATSAVSIPLAWALRAALPFGDDERRTTTEKGVTDVRAGA
ncbi:MULTISPECIES: acyltransferase family protein [Tsukamurella]|uniref:Acyltransferase n=2 Tax=Tsukamurella TaxID=2060 RepID=A0A5C5RXG4_9ACTN|nr:MULTISPECIES: acyltransferase [Tsukamurella]NMD56596.1 acyltransferase [Tsukamurella columbiensis]TWS27474.1 acyltransferase [Tsukamurella conjunctivitidis]